MGAEAEKFGVFAADGSPLPFEGDQSIVAIFARLVERHGWHEEREHEGGPVVALRRGASSITLEPGAQLELSGAPQESIHQICAEFRGHMAELRDVSDDLGIRWLGLGFHPFARQSELPWVPKRRYTVMREYLPTRGSGALDMMRRTATVQANVDFDGEDDAMRKLRVGLRLSPLVAAMFANSPWHEGHPSGDRSLRTRVWLHMDPDRSGLLPFAWHDALSYRRYVEYALDAPMFLIWREGDIVSNTSQTFRRFLADGLRGYHATMGDWLLHLNTLFPEVRLKRTIELRSADAQATDLVCALPALWKGVLYCPQALQKAEALGERWGYDEAMASLDGIARDALRARLAGREVAAWAGDLIEIAEGGLERLSHLDRKGQDERIHLARLRELVAAGRCPADVLLEGVGDGPHFMERVLTQARV
ncbi:MAG: glutamate--cysteine ligase [Myxococcota bacterium]